MTRPESISPCMAGAYSQPVAHREVPQVYTFVECDMTVHKSVEDASHETWIETPPRKASISPPDSLQDVMKGSATLRLHLAGTSTGAWVVLRKDRELAIALNMLLSGMFPERAPLVGPRPSAPSLLTRCTRGFLPCGCWVCGRMRPYCRRSFSLECSTAVNVPACRTSDVFASAY